MSYLTSTNLDYLISAEIERLATDIAHISSIPSKYMYSSRSKRIECLQSFHAREIETNCETCSMIRKRKSIRWRHIGNNR